MDIATRVKPILPAEIIQIRSNSNSDTSNLKEQIRKPMNLALKLEKEAEIIVDKFSIAQYKVSEVVINTPIKIMDEVITLSTATVHNKIREYGKIT